MKMLYCYMYMVFPLECYCVQIKVYIFALLPPFLLQINGNDLREVPHQTAVSFFHNTGEVVTLLVERGAEHRIRVRASRIAPLDVFLCIR